MSTPDKVHEVGGRQQQTPVENFHRKPYNRFEGQADAY
jgi:hypothetical protein